MELEGNIAVHRYLRDGGGSVGVTGLRTCPLARSDASRWSVCELGRSAWFQCARKSEEVCYDKSAKARIGK